MPEQLVAWLFPGQGAQDVGMGRDLYDNVPAARALFDEADQALGYSISRLCFEGPAGQLQETRHAQPAIFVTSLACLEAARGLGSLPTREPAFVAGHSLGECTALVAAGALDFADGLRLVQERGRLMQEAAEQRSGAMAAILGLDEAAVTAVCAQAGAEVCNLNAPGQTVIGGPTEAVERALTLALERGAQRGVMLRVGGAFHTSLMAPAAAGMARAVEQAPLRDARVPVIANTDARPLVSAAGLRDELRRQITSPVRWQQSMQYLRTQGVVELVEFGPGRVLTGLARRIDRAFATRNVSDLAGARPVAATPLPP